MKHVSHQTVRLGKGKHSSPQTGACVMELASMLAGEPFSDHPRSVSRTLAAFLRGYNDMVDDDRRQDLYDCAAKVVGTAASAAVERKRVQRLVSWADAMSKRKRWSLLCCVRRPKAYSDDEKDYEAAARYAIDSLLCVTDEIHASVLTLLDELAQFGIKSADDLDLIIGQRALLPESAVMR
jgi:hypothetical protein